MKEKIQDLLQESIQIEFNVSKLYNIFYRIFTEDKVFWWQLQMEELNHASLIKSGMNSFDKLDLFPFKMICDNLEETKATNKQLEELILKFEKHHPSREEAFNTAYQIENSACELHFQDFMSQDHSSKIDDIFRNLNQDDKDHADRIEAYMKEHNIKISNNN